MRWPLAREAAALRESRYPSPMRLLLPHCLSTATRMPSRTLLVSATLTGACASPTAPGPDLAAANVPAFENLTGLEALPARGTVAFALPMKVGGGSGAPLRAVALVPR